MLTSADSCFEDGQEADVELVDVLDQARERWLLLCEEAAEDDDTSSLHLIPEEINRFFSR